MSRPPLGGFFDGHAPTWDDCQTPGLHEAIGRIFAAASFRPGLRVLDVGAGTGVLYPHFQAAGAGDYTAVDISPEMVRQFRAKHPEARILESDYEQPISFPGLFDAVMIFNAFPHFRNEETVFRLTHSYLSPGGRLFICHSMNREALNEHHRNAGGVVSEDILISDERIAGHYRKAGFVSIKVENADCFFSEGTKPPHA
ncbi:MAG: methyltransferase domain-containing protein [Candidatus Aminicenantes bacterium]|nr:methyltransferase domain-containing protein [Candidatus Aminicenantes bacterium]